MTPTDPRVDPRLVPDNSRAIVVAKDQPEYIPLPSVITPDHKVITRWELSTEERRAILNGEDIFLTIWGTPIRPVMLTVGPIDWKEL